ncbi:MAG: hypothetical protein Q9187_000950 [Circinaria calcarea]
MAGSNPFRQLAQQPQKATRKTVRIVSPHSSTSDSDDNGHHSPSAYFDYRIKPKKEYPPPGTTPSSQPFASSPPVDPFNEEQGIDETSEGAGSHMSHAEIMVTKGLVAGGVLSQSSRRTSTMPSNPFSRASQLVEQTPRTSATNEQSVRGPIASMTSSTSVNRVPLDVDAFKRLLLTGDKDSTTNSAPPTPSTHGFPLHGNQHGDSSSNTDSSSLSRQSILGSQTDLHLETPRTSHEISPSDEDHQYQFQSRSPKSDRFLPPIPRSRNGNVLKGTLPQMVAFAEPASYTNQYEFAPPTSPMPKSLRSPTDLNKPLPPPPTSHSPDSPADTPGAINQNPAETLSEPPNVSAPRVRVAPPPPLSRRLSQLRSQYPSNNPGTSTSITEESVTELVPPAVTAKPPAPLPPRRRGADRSQSLLETRLPSELEADIGKSSIKSQSSRPPPPPRRTPSSSSARLPRRISPNMSNPSPLPPPPPPRRRGSSGSSFSSRRVSGEVNHADVEGHYHASTSAHSSITPDIIETKNEKDVLADLTALQREVDALRGKYERRDSTDKT